MRTTERVFDAGIVKQATFYIIDAGVVMKNGNYAPTASLFPETPEQRSTGPKVPKRKPDNYLDSKCDR